MTFLPVAERELRVAARRRGVTRGRMWGAVAAFVVAVLFVGYWAAERSSMPVTQQGQALFGILVWLAFAAALSSGLFLTADCISEEKRDGTFGLLFLTDLRGYDVVIGKLLASSLVGFYGLLAVFPILAVTVLMGGVTGVEVGKAALALASTMLFSLGAGLFVSVVSHHGQKAMLGTLFLLALVTAGAPGVDASLHAANLVVPLRAGILISPAYLMGEASTTGGSEFWRAFAANQVVTGGFFVAAMFLAPRVWQERRRSWADRSAANGTRRARAEASGLSAVRARRRSRGLLEGNPILWLCARELWQNRLAWAWALLVTASVLVILSVVHDPTVVAVNYISGFAILPFYLIASQAGRFFIEGRQKGSLELLLCTPVSPRQIIAGQWHGWLRRFGPAVLVLLLAQMVLSVASTYHMWTMMNGMRPTGPAPAATRTGTTGTTTVANNGTTVVSGTTYSVTVTNQGVGVFPSGDRQDTFGGFEIVLSLGFAGLSAVAALMNMAALIWFGMWTGLTSTKLMASSLKTITLVQIIPWLVSMFGVMVLLPILGMFFSSGGGSIFLWFSNIMLAAVAVLALGKDFVFIAYARSRLLAQLRARAAGELGRKGARVNQADGA